MLKEFNQNTAGWVADKVMTLSGSKFMNNFSTRLNLRLYTDMLGDLAKDKNLSDFHNRFLGKWKLTGEDLRFVEPMLKYIDSPKDLDALPNEMFADNPLGISPQAYKVEMAKRVHTFLLDNIYQGSPKPGWAQQYYANGYSSDHNSYRASVVRSATQFKRIAMKQFTDARQLANLKDGYSGSRVNKAYHGAYIFGGLAATVTAGGFLRSYMIDVLKEQGDYEKVNEKYLDDGHYSTIFKESFFKYGPWSLATEPLGNVVNSLRRRGTPQLTDITTPSSNLFWLPPALALKALGNMWDDKPALSKQDVKMTMNLAKTVVPLQSHWMFLPIAEERKNFEQELAESIANSLK
jgi:hypothetical protein